MGIVQLSSAVFAWIQQCAFRKIQSGARSLVLALIVLPMALQFSLCRSMAAAEATRDDIEAAYLFRFLDFVEFPADSPAGTKNFYMCVVGDDRLLPSLKSALKGKSIGSRSVVLKQIASDESAKACHVLFVDGKRRAVTKKLLEIPLDPILTVTEDPQPNLAGQVIRFYFKDDHLRFDIDLENARRRGLTISSRLIQLSRSFQ